MSINQEESLTAETGLMIMGQNSIGTGNSGLFLEVRGADLEEFEDLLGLEKKWPLPMKEPGAR